MSFQKRREAGVQPEDGSCDPALWSGWPLLRERQASGGKSKGHVIRG